MKDLYICVGCGFTSTHITEFEIINGKEYCQVCVVAGKYGTDSNENNYDRVRPGINEGVKTKWF